MAKLIYLMLTSLDGYTDDGHGRFGWAAPDARVHAFVNDLDRSIGTYLYGRRMYETMTAWETDPALAATDEVYRDFAAQWRATDKIVYSTALESPVTARTTIEREFDPDAVRRRKQHADADLAVSGPGLAAHAIRAGLVDEYHQFLFPVVVGGGTRFLPDGVRQELELTDQRRFDSGVVFLRYRVAG